jgi:protein TonB
MEHKLIKMRLAIFIFTAVLHGLIFFFVSVKYQNHDVIKQEQIVPFGLVNININEDEPPELSKIVVMETVPHPPRTQHPKQKEVADNIIEIEKSPVEETVTDGYEKSLIEEPPSEQYAAYEHDKKSNAEDKTAAEKSSALVREYVRRNFDYISRRVRSKLVYPAQARRTGLDGIVEVLFTLNTDGSVSGVSVIKSAGAEILDAAAIAAIKSAAPFRAPPVSAKLLIPVVFNLR